MKIHRHLTCKGYDEKMRGARVPMIATWVCAAAAVLALFGAVGSWGANGDGKAKLNGAYKVICRGTYEGDGNVAVGAKNVNVNLHLVHVETGAKGHLKAPNLDLKDGRFSGTGTYEGQTVKVSGRIDPPDGQYVKVPRMSGNIAMHDGSHLRFVGEKAGGGGGGGDDDDDD